LNLAPLSELAPHFGVFLIGLSKAGFATGLGMLSTPLMASSMPAKDAVGVVLPLLCVADILTLVVYWKKWDFSLIKNLLIGCLLGVAVGIFFVAGISEKFLRVSIGITGLVMTTLLLFRLWWKPEAVWTPKIYQELLIGAAAGLTSTVAHAAGPIVAIFLLARRVNKELFVATSALYFFVGNWMKVPPYVAVGLINPSSLLKGIYLLPALPIGVLAGYLSNKYLPQKWFVYLSYALLIVSSLDLIFR
jgi:hypothetical protein